MTNPEHSREMTDLREMPQPGPYSGDPSDAFIPRVEATTEERILMRALAKCWTERDAAYANLRDVQARCTELVEESRTLRAERDALAREVETLCNEGRAGLLVDGLVWDAGKVQAVQARLYRLLEENAALPKGERFHLPTAVREFMSRAGQTMPEVPTVPSDEVVKLRLRLVLEEALELFIACCPSGPAALIVRDAEAILCEMLERTEINVDLEEAADALADVAYVVEGTALAFGIRSDEVLAEVHSANLRKDFSNVPEGGKVRKPEGWQPPDVRRCLVAMGWNERVSSSNEHE